MRWLTSQVLTWLAVLTGLLVVLFLLASRPVPSHPYPVPRGADVQAADVLRTAGAAVPTLHTARARKQWCATNVPKAQSYATQAASRPTGVLFVQVADAFDRFCTDPATAANVGVQLDRLSVGVTGDVPADYRAGREQTLQ